MITQSASIAVRNAGRGLPARIAHFDRAMHDKGGEGRNRVIIEAVRPRVDCGRFPAKAVLGERVVVEADIFADGHDLVQRSSSIASRTTKNGRAPACSRCRTIAGAGPSP